jgi:hypothetical protein
MQRRAVKINSRSPKQFKKKHLLMETLTTPHIREYFMEESSIQPSPLLLLPSL